MSLVFKENFLITTCRSGLIRIWSRTVDQEKEKQEEESDDDASHGDADEI